MRSDAVAGTSPAVLEVEGLVAGYGRSRALGPIAVAVAEGETVTLIGANGAGKSTLLRAIAGLLQPWEGTVRLRGRDVTRMRPDRLVRRGLALVPEGRLLFGPMTVAQNLELGAYVLAGRRGRPRAEEALREVHGLFPVLEERAHQEASTLSGGEQQMLAIGRALMSRPSVLLLDEPSLGLAPRVIAEIFGALGRLKERGLTVLLVEQDAKVALRHADRGYVMRTGEVVLSGRAEDLLADDDVRRIYLGAWTKE